MVYLQDVLTRSQRAFSASPLHYAFDNGVLSLPLTRLIEQQGKHRVSELESSRLIQWQGQWRRVDEIAAELRSSILRAFVA